jgi:hypothetical protein
MMNRRRALAPIRLSPRAAAPIIFIPTAVICLALSACAERSSLTKMQNAGGEIVICKPPSDALALSDVGREAIVQWCRTACEARGYRWIDRGSGDVMYISDLDLGRRERRIAETYMPPQCLPFDPRPMGIAAPVPECTGILFRDRKCPD